MMSGQIYFSLLNPAIAFTFAAMFFVMGRRFPNQQHFPLIGSAFALSALAFILQDFPLIGDEATAKLLSNAIFVACVITACSSALVRVGAAVPRWRFGLISAASFAIFCFYLYVEPAILVRVTVLGAAMAAVALLTFILLVRQERLETSDRLIALATLIGFVLAVLRPVLALTGLLEVDDGGSFQQSTYWATVQAFTPILTGTIALLFLAAMSLDTFEQLRAEADHDYLTGLLNRRGFETAVGTALAEGDAEKPALLMADIDDFKKINDSFGHKVGDQVISGVARVLSSQGNALFAGRVGGEEFALYYEGCDHAALHRHAEAIRLAVSRLAVAGLPAGYPLTLSIGLHARTGGESLSEMLIEADRALYKAKASGKNRAVLSPTALRPVERQARLA